MRVDRRDHTRPTFRRTHRRIRFARKRVAEFRQVGDDAAHAASRVHASAFGSRDARSTVELDRPGCTAIVVASGKATKMNASDGRRMLSSDLPTDYN
jgi:hypothetical protein